MSQKPQDPPAAGIAAAPLSRRKVFAGAGAAGAVAAVAAVLPVGKTAPAPALAAAAAVADPAAGGYQLTDHVRRYYQTARV